MISQKVKEAAVVLDTQEHNKMAYSLVPHMPEIIFRAYDIRGIVGETLTEDGVYTTRAYLREHRAFKPNATWEQSTGKFDRNGKEVYKGDGIHAVHKSGSGITTYAGVVVWDTKYAAWAISYEHSDAGKCTEHLMNIGIIKVIGNIHENPELLT